MWNYPSKAANNGATIAGRHMAGEFNNYMAEILRAITSMGIAPTSYPVDPTVAVDPNMAMLAEALARAASLGVAYADTGSVNSYVLSAVGADVVPPKALFTGMRARWIPAHANTGASTANVAGIGSKAILRYDGSALSAGDISGPVDMEYSSAANSGAGAWLLMPWCYAASSVVSSGSSVGDVKNLLINGGFRVNQRNFAGGALSAGAYGYDRWKADTGGANVSVTADVVTLTSGTIVQVVEQPNPTVASTSVTLSVEDLTSGNLSVVVGSQSGTITAGSGRRGVTLSLAAGDSGNLTVKLSPASGAVTFKRVQLERGASATTWEFRPLPTEKVLCKRYWQKGWNEAIGVGTPNASSSFYKHKWMQVHLPAAKSASTLIAATVILPVEMRTTPTVTTYDGAGTSGKISLYTSASGANSNGTTPYDVQVGPEAITVYDYASTGYGLFCLWTADAEL